MALYTYNCAGLFQAGGATCVNWLLANTDETVMASAIFDIVPPVTRNNLQKTQHNMNFALFTNYVAPTFDPDDL